MTDTVVSGLGLAAPLIRALTAGGAKHVVFDAITADAPIPLIEQGIAFYQRQGCDAIVAFGGGSPMDAAKAIALVGRQPQAPAQAGRLLQGAARAGAPVRSSHDGGHRLGSDRRGGDLRPGAPAQARDRRHAPRAGDGRARSDADDRPAAAGHRRHRHGRADARGRGVRRPVGHAAVRPHGARRRRPDLRSTCPRAYRKGKDLAAREQMSLAATYAGLAFTRANVGYVHAIAHQLGARYHTPHGLANAIMLPHVLAYLAPAIGKRLALLAVRAGVGKAGERAPALARKFVASVDAAQPRPRHPGHARGAARRRTSRPSPRTRAGKRTRTTRCRNTCRRQICEGLLRKALPPAPGRRRGVSGASGPRAAGRRRAA